MLRRPLPLLVTCVLLVVAAVVAGCGSSAGSSSSELAAAVPRDALLYTEVTLRPSGATRDDALAAAGKILDTGAPAARIHELLQQAFAKADPPVDFSRDIDPWLGDRAGLWVGTPSGRGAVPPVGAVVQVRDEALARKKLAVLAAHDGKPAKRSIDGEDYEVYRGDDPTAVAFRDGELLVGTEPAVKRMLTLADDGGLAKGAAYTKAVGSLEENRLVSFYMDTNRLLDLAELSNPQAAQQIAPLRRMIGKDALKPVVGEMTADGDKVALEFVGSAPRGGAGRFGGLASLTGADLLKALPESSWAAVAVPKAGATLQAAFAQLAGTLGSAAVRGQVRQATGLDLEQDVFSWIGDVGLFARGTTIGSVDGGVVIQVTDRDRAAAAFGKFVGLARTRGGLDPKPVRVRGAASAFAVSPPRSPKPIVLARSDDRMVLAFGASYAKAVAALGDGFVPSMLFSFPAIASLVDSSGDTGADWSRARQYLRHLGVIATGTNADGDTLRSRIVLGLE
jgi:hypothetical protein